MQNIMLRLVREPSEFFTMRDTWNDLLKRSRADTIFLTWEWMYTWWECFGTGKKLFIIIAEDDSGIVGIAPLHITRERFFGLRTLKHIEFLGSTGVITEYQDFIILQDREDEILPCFLDIIFNNSPEWDVMNFVSMKQDGLNLKKMRAYCDKKDKEYLEYNLIISPYIELSQSLDEYMKSLSNKSRWKLKDYRKKLEKDRLVELVETNDVMAVQKDLEIITMLHQKRWQEKGGSGSFNNSREDYWKFHRKVAKKFFENGWLYLLKLVVEGKPVAGHYSFIYGNIVYCHTVGFDPEWSNFNVGSVLQLLAIENTIRKGAREFDFLRGTEQYKYYWTKKERISVDTVILRSKGIARRIEIERRIRRFIKSLIPITLAEKIYQRLINRGT